MPRITATSIAATARIALRRRSRTGQAATANSQPATAAIDQDSRAKITNTELAASTRAMTGPGNRRMTAIGAVARNPSSDRVAPLPRYHP
jgi:hypothetical protein